MNALVGNMFCSGRLFAISPDLEMFCLNGLLTNRIGEGCGGIKFREDMVFGVHMCSNPTLGAWPLHKCSNVCFEN